jgi:hypothetical protein
VGDFFAFRMLITPRFIQILFAIGLAGIVLGSLAALAGDQPVAGILFLLFGVLYWRILCELFFVLFRINDTLSGIKRDTGAMAPATAPAEVAVPAASEPAVAEIAAAPAAAATAPEGWYDDSERPGHKRWWDGTAWGKRDDE